MSIFEHVCVRSGRNINDSHLTYDAVVLAAWQTPLHKLKSTEALTELLVL